MQIQVIVPDFTTVAKRAKTLSVALNASKVKSAVCLVVDRTGLKVYGEGEWKVRKYGWSKRRTWRKLHLAVNAETQEIEAEVLTDNATDDASQVDELPDQARIGRVPRRGTRTYSHRQPDLRSADKGGNDPSGIGKKGRNKSRRD